MNLQGQENKHARIQCRDNFCYSGTILKADDKLLILLDKFGNEVSIESDFITRAEVRPIKRAQQ